MSRAEDTHLAKCPVTGCTNDANGGLCWRHRQFVRPALIKTIEKARDTLCRNLGTTLEGECRADLGRAVSAACAEAQRNIAAIRATNGAPDAL